MDFEDVYVPTVLGRLRVRSAGTGPAMLFWPSLLMDGALWTPQAEYFAATRRVLLLDPPGHGASEPLTGPFTFDDCARCVVQILDHLGLSRVDLVGNSWGGMVGVTFAAHHPDRVGVSVLLNCTASPAGRRQRLEYGLLTRAARLIGGVRGPLLPSALGAFLGPTSRATRPHAVTALRATLSRLDVTSVPHAVTSVVPRRPDQRPLLATIRTPVLVLAGAEDATFPVAETKEVADGIPGAEFVVLDGVAHLAALEVPETVNTLIDGFLRAQA
ncbi:3-oxoadipate enol-lactonase [Crossiella equi]|uniref:3-oxoadipate enol-lactonase n=1 Tax=Crossiella equi TaxID=130796 RepID=A0ABS5A6B8_9PSEU|nr:alpha/beta fold hydrolase [Crossiella equi]MBP2472139.1 3-oxoadipate enol-lactonase [Crossiella equi]